jgi:hypothetical protein
LHKARKPQKQTKVKKRKERINPRQYLILGSIKSKLGILQA